MDSVRGLYCMFIIITSARGGGDGIEPLVEAVAEIIGLDAAQRIDGAGLPDHQSRMVFGHDFWQGGRHIRGRLLHRNVRGDLDFGARQPLLRSACSSCAG